jgi:hypothetical protein
MMKRLVFGITISCALCPLLNAGPEQISGKEMKQAVEPLAAVQWYADNEWNVNIWGTYVFTANGGEQAPDQGIVLWSSDRYLGADDAWGGGIDLKYFFHRYFGVGIEGYGLAVHREAPEVSHVVEGENGTPVTLHDEDRFVGAVLGTLTLRYPVGRFAPYIFGGLGGIFGGGDVPHLEFTGVVGNGTDYFEVYRGGDTTKLLGQLGGGLEIRCTRHIGVMADFGWNVVDGPQNNFGMARTGLTFAF